MTWAFADRLRAILKGKLVLKGIVTQYLLSALRRLGVEISADIHFLLASSKGTR